MVGEVLRGFDLAGVFGCAVMGGVLARSRGLDPVGFVVLAILSGLGGGIIRDTLLQFGPPVALVDPAYIGTASAGALVAFFLPFDGALWRRCFPVVDACAVGCWATAGAQKTLGAGLAWWAAILLGIVTAVGGSAVRDVVLGRIPLIFGGTTLYATSALIGAATMVALHAVGAPAAGLVAGTTVGAAVTLLARWRGWELRGAYAWRGPGRRRAEPNRP
ncbi:trimeric intracellular cation channel family protein [Pseudonocardia endophytica]|uniref:Putative membrane protein YeiH n=1 Tax=Pseudonocardia endophytica TaxID=401976 RepID=A0A4R1HHS6_PSEEN|nr:TRIC cation channel family protein [Pseudonocardia endophytica]TCK21804.1 putative membrane protein YeiH [Pseudonocardia endophytica]